MYKLLWPVIMIVFGCLMDEDKGSSGGTEVFKIKISPKDTIINTFDTLQIAVEADDGRKISETTTLEGERAITIQGINTKVVYGSSGTYQVRIVAKDQSNVYSDTAVATVTVLNIDDFKIEASFSDSEVTVSDSVTFTLTASDNRDIKKSFWEGGNQSGEQAGISFRIAFETAGEKTVKLTAKDLAGNVSDTAVVMINVNYASLYENFCILDIDMNTDGIVDNRIEQNFNGNGDIILETQDFGGDGIIDMISTFTYDPDGNILTEFYDENGDGIDDEKRFFKYNSDGKITSEQYDFDNDGNMDQMVDYTYDSNGNNIALQSVEMFNGIIDTSSLNSQSGLFTYDNNGVLVESQWDVNLDGFPDNKFVFTEDGNGNILAQGMLLSDTTGVIDSIVDSEIRSTYDAEGNMLTQVFDGDADGLEEQKYIWTYDANGEVKTHELIDNGIVQWHDIYTYDAEGNLILYEVDYGKDKVIEERRAYFYDAMGNVLKVIWDLDGDGVTDESYFFNYNCWLN